MAWMWVARILFLPLIIYELLNAVGVLHQTLTFSWWGLVITSIPVWAALEISFAHFKRKGFRFPWWVIIPVMMAVYFDAIGDIMKFYDLFKWWDQVAHATGSIATTFWAGSVVMPLWKTERLASKYRFLFLACFGVTVGVIYEFAEYFQDVIGATHQLGDGFDTVNDLLWDTFGAVSVAALLPHLKLSHHHDRRSHPKTQNHS